MEDINRLIAIIKKYEISIKKYKLAINKYKLQLIQFKAIEDRYQSQINLKNQEIESLKDQIKFQRKMIERLIDRPINVEMHNTNTGGGNYNESIGSDYIEGSKGDTTT